MYSVDVHLQRKPASVHPCIVHSVQRAAKLNAFTSTAMMRAHNKIIFILHVTAFSNVITLDIVIIRDGWQLRSNT